MARLFGAYIIVDWSAAEGRRSGADSVWIAVVRRDVRFRLAPAELHNPASRAEAEALLRTILADVGRRNEKALIGFDFGFGFPEGTAAMLKLPGDPAWAAMWRWLTGRVVDKADGTNNRFQVAATMNRLMTGAARPFWGAPARQAQTTLSSTKPPPGATDVPPEFRRTERATQGKGKQGAKSVWQMHGAGVVGGQTILGIAAAQRLLTELGDAGAVWPFSFGWRAPTAADLAPLSAVLVEVYPSLFPITPEPGEVKDRAQVRTTAEHLARLDEADKLAALFAAPKTASEEDVAAVVNEEGWILGA